MSRSEEHSPFPADDPRPAPRGPIVFGTRDGYLVGHGIAEVIEADRSDAADLDARVLRSLREARQHGQRAPIAFGHLSFRRDRPSRLIRPAHASHVSGRALRDDLDRRARLTTPRRRLVRHENLDDAQFSTLVVDVLHQLAGDTELSKVVVGRWMDLVCEPPISPDELLTPLLDRAEDAYLFGLPLMTGPDDRQHLVGASPELLVSRRAQAIRSVPLAGSAPRSTDPDEDRRRGAALADSAKDLREHAFVTEAIARELGPLCTRLDVPDEPHLIATDTMWHLATDIRGTLAATDEPSASALRLAQILHPTPAVCGTPRDAAYATIADHEDDERGVMTGAVGWVDADGDGDFAVTIRSALIDGALVRLFAGAGIVLGSDPACEAHETAAKLRTMLRAVESA